MPLSSNFEYVLEEYKQRVDANISYSFLRFVVFVITIIGNLPDALVRILMRDNTLGLNVTISNTPGSQTPMFFCDKKVYDIGGIGSNLGGSGLTMLISSYCSKVKIQILADLGIPFSSERFLQILSEFLSECLKSVY